MGFLSISIRCAGLAGTIATVSAASVDIPTNTWVEVTPTYVGAPDGGQIWPMVWNNKGAYDPVSQRVIVLDRWYDPVRTQSIYANAVMAYDPATNVVTVLKLGNWYNQPVTWIGGSSGTVTAPILPANHDDPTPVDRHPLGGVSAMPDHHGLLLVDGLNQGAIGPTTVVDPNAENDTAILTHHPIDSWAFDLDTRRWTQVANTTDLAPNPRTDAGSPVVMTYDSANRVVVLFVQKNSAWSGSVTWLFDPDTRRWTEVAQDPTSLTTNTSASGIAYDSRRGRLLTFGGGYDSYGTNPTLSAYSVTANAWTRLADCPQAANAPGFDYDSNHDVFLALIGTATWIYDPASDAWSQIDTPMGRYYTTHWQSVTYDPAQDVFVFQGGTWDHPQWFLFRYASASAAPTITQQPADLSVDVGGSATFSLLAAGSPPPQYRWQAQDRGASGFTDIAGATAAAYLRAGAVLEDDGMRVRCVVSNSLGTITSSAATLSVASSGGGTTAGGTTGGGTTTGGTTGSTDGSGSTASGGSSGGDHGGSRGCGAGVGAASMALALAIFARESRRSARRR